MARAIPAAIAIAPGFMICRSCGKTLEFGDEEIETLLSRAAARGGFTAERVAIEIQGLCADCALTASAFQMRARRKAAQQAARRSGEQRQHIENAAGEDDHRPRGQAPVKRGQQPP